MAPPHGILTKKMVMDKQHYKDKALSLLSDTNNYRTTNKDPTTKLRNQLFNTVTLMTQSTKRCT